MMIRHAITALWAVLWLCAPTLCQSQEEISKFATDGRRLFDLKDDKGLDKLIKSSTTMPSAVVFQFTNLRFDVQGGKSDLVPYCDWIKAGWTRVFEGGDTLDRVERWTDSQDNRSLQQYRNAQRNVQKAWQYFTENTAKDNTKRAPFEESRDVLIQAAKSMEQTGNKNEAADAWYYVALSLEKIPDKTVQDRQDRVFALEQFVTLRESWNYTQDTYFTLIKNLLKAQREELEAKKKAEDKRKDEGYGDNVKGIDAMVLPGAKEEALPLAFQALAGWEDEADFCVRGGPLPPFWFNVAFGEGDKDERMGWFRGAELSLMRLAPNKFGVSTMPSDASRTQPIEANAKAKPVLFHLDANKSVPYAMCFWIGSDREKLGEAEVNLAPSPQNTPVYYRSASSWTVAIGGEALTLYDDNASGQPMDADPFAGDFRSATIGYPKSDARSKIPLLDGMRVGKGPRQPFSEFVRVGGAWRYLRRLDDGKLGLRDLNPEYVKFGKVKLVWAGPKPTAPDQLVIQGRGDLKSAMFDVASGKEVEVPAGEYTVVFGRIVEGKGARLQSAVIGAGDSQPFTVEPGKVLELKMGAPFALDFERQGEGDAVRIDGTQIRLLESSGCVLGEFHGMSLVPEVVASKNADGKGAKPVGKFVKLADSELLTALAGKLPDIGILLAVMSAPAGAKDSMVFEAKVGAGMKVGLSIKKHPLFGKLDSKFR